MLMMRRIPNGGLGPPVRPGWTWLSRTGLVLLALATVTLDGCSTLGNGCGGGCGSGLGTRTTGFLRNNRLTRMFRRDVIVTDGGCAGEPVLAPGVAPAPILTSPGAVVTPAPTAAPSGEGAPLQLQPVEPSEPGPPASGSSADPAKTGANALNKKTLYETQKATGGTTTSRRVPTFSDPNPPATTARSSSGDNPLNDLPPLSAVAQPAEDVTPPVPPAAETLSAVIPLPQAASAPEPAPAPAAPALAPAPAAPALAAAIELPPKPAAQAISMTEGISRFKVVEPQVAGGSLPTTPGWNFLAEKGYRTVLDLRSHAEVQPGDDAAALHVGLRYMILPVTPESLDDALVKRFQEEIQLAGNRPIYFFDTDGARSAALWYVYLISVKQFDEPTAAKEVEELGPKEGRLWMAATAYLAAHRKAMEKPAQVPDPVPASDPSPGPAPAPQPNSSAEVPSAPVASTATPQPPDPTSWKPFAAMLVTGLSVPLAFAGRTAVGNALSYIPFRRASLPALERQPAALPVASGE